MAGRPRKPTALKVLHGDFDKDPQRRNRAEPEPETEIPKCPEKLTVVGRNEWRRVCGELKLLGVISLAERGSIEQYCQAYEKLHECEKVVKEQGRFFESENGPKEHPASKAARSYADQCIKLLASFGLTPTSRTRLAVQSKAAKDEKENKYLA